MNQPPVQAATVRITRKGIVMAILIDALPKFDLEDLAPLAERIYREVVAPLEANRQPDAVREP